MLFLMEHQENSRQMQSMTNFMTPEQNPLDVLAYVYEMDFEILG